MNDERSKRAEAVALFRYGLIADFLHPPAEQASTKLYARLREKAVGSYCIPGSRRTRVAVETLKDWLDAYRAGGFEALRPKPRKDIGQARSIPQDVADLLVHLKDEHRDYSVAMVIEEARRLREQAGGLPLPVSTVHRLLSRAGVMGKPAAAPSSKDHRHFSYQRAGELWMSDVMHGPAVTVTGRRKQKTYLIGLLDDATRVVPFSAFALCESIAAFLPVFEQGIRRRGIPQRLYVDNGALYRCHQLSLVCAKLGTTLIHARPYQPAGKGKQERWFRTVRMRFLPTLGEGDTASVDTLNRRLWAWVEGEYHQSPHQGLEGQSPLDAWAMRSAEVRVPGPELDLRELFLFEQKRRVQKDRTVSLDGVLYEVDAALVGEGVVLRYDPSKRGAPIDVWHQGTKVGTARVVDAYANCFVKRNHERKTLEPDAAPRAPKPGLRMRDLHPHPEDP
jgi:transposase InsO family protein